MAPDGKGPLTESKPDGRHPGVPGPAAPGAPGPKAAAAPGPGQNEDLTESVADLAGGAEGALGPGPFVGFGLRQAVGALRFLSLWQV